jgi:nucleotide-binding universal stress UspA family protein
MTDMIQRDASIHRILVAVDGSNESAAGVRWVAALASARGAEVVAAHVTESAREGYRLMGPPIAVLNEANWRAS